MNKIRIPSTEILKRQRDLMTISPDKTGIFVILGYKVRYMTKNIFYPFVQNTDLLYMGGVSEPDTGLIIKKVRNSYFESHVFVHEPTDSEKLWEGGWLGVQGMKDTKLFDHTHRSTDFLNVFKHLIRHNPNDVVYFDVPNFGYTEEQFSRDSRQHLGIPGNIMWSDNRFGEILKLCKDIKPLSPVIHRQRLIKSADYEIKNLQKAALIASDAFHSVLRKTIGLSQESDISNLFEYEVRKHGADGLAYVPVIAYGENACTIHYTRNNEPLGEDGLILMDAGCRYQGYCSDVTRTFPRNGKFNKHQTLLYQTLLDIQKRLIEECSPMNSLDDLYEMSREWILNDVCMNIFGLSKQNANYIIDRVYPHHVGHHLGMDVHDGSESTSGNIMTSDNRINQWTKDQLLSGMCITIEPGIYIRKDIGRDILSMIPKEYWGMGIRIEDNVVVSSCKETKTVLTKSIPKEISDIEMIMNIEQ
jgi:intermediate cleaving peptidase 55